MRRDETGNFMLFLNDQETVVEISSTDARGSALRVLITNNTDTRTQSEHKDDHTCHTGQTKT